MKIFFSHENSGEKNINFKQNKKQETVAILGSSKTKDSIMDYMELCSEVTKSLVLADKNILHGCGNSGIMGSAYNAAKTYSKKDENNKPAQNLAIVKTPLWGDEDMKNCIVLDSANSEAERIEKFSNLADKIIIFPGGAATMQEAATLISRNNYTPENKRKKIVLAGRDYFKGLDEQYETIYQNGLLNGKPEELYTLADTKEEILSA